MFFRITSDCIACGYCFDNCPHGAILEGETYTINLLRCEGCGSCYQACPSGAIIKY
ncbi:MAG: 4Fe-4S binding protein [Peptococcaceae bacterium]|nr:4Fe-4S binding protein [Peptococcaceae bacterium]